MFYLIVNYNRLLIELLRYLFYKLFTLTTETKELTVDDSAGNCSVIPSGNENTVIPGTSITKTKGRIIATQNELNKKNAPAILVPNNVSNVPCTTENNLQPDAQNTSAQDSLSTDQFL